MIQELLPSLGQNSVKNGLRQSEKRSCGQKNQNVEFFLETMDTAFSKLKRREGGHLWLSVLASISDGKQAHWFLWNGQLAHLERKQCWSSVQFIFTYIVHLQHIYKKVYTCFKSNICSHLDVFFREDLTYFSKRMLHCVLHLLEKLHGSKGWTGLPGIQTLHQLTSQSIRKWKYKKKENIPLPKLQQLLSLVPRPIWIVV